MDDTLKEIEISTSLETDHLLRSKLAYHFMFKQVKVEELMKFIGILTESREQEKEGRREKEREARYQGIHP